MSNALDFPHRHPYGAATDFRDIFIPMPWWAPPFREFRAPVFFVLLFFLVLIFIF